jgi:hypothetical protein
MAHAEGDSLGDHTCSKPDICTLKLGHTLGWVAVAISDVYIKTLFCADQDNIVGLMGHARHVTS